MVARREDKTLAGAKTKDKLIFDARCVAYSFYSLDKVKKARDFFFLKNGITFLIDYTTIFLNQKWYFRNTIATPFFPLKIKMAFVLFLSARDTRDRKNKALTFFSKYTTSLDKKAIRQPVDSKSKKGTGTKKSRSDESRHFRNKHFHRARS